MWIYNKLDFRTKVLKSQVGTFNDVPDFSSFRSVLFICNSIVTIVLHCINYKIKYITHESITPKAHA